MNKPHFSASWPVARLSVALTRDELIEWGEAFGARAAAPLLVGISGELGAGKTTLVQAICRGYGVSAEATSPTFNLVHEYQAPKGKVFHLDLYRLRNASELTNIGWDDIVNSGALVLVEWPERAEQRVPGTGIHVTLAHLPNDPQRRFLTTG